MKKRKLLFLSVLFVLIATVFLSSCFLVNTNKAKKIPVYGNYYLVGGGAVTHGKKQVDLNDVVFRAIKAQGYKTISTYGTGMIAEFSGNTCFFNSKYYFENADETTKDYTLYYCFGYMDLVTLTPNIFRFTEVKHFEDYRLYNGVVLDKYENLIIYSADSKSFEIVDVDTLDRISADVDVAENYGLCYASGNTLLFRDRTDDIYCAVNYNTGERDDEQIPALVEKRNADNYVEYDGKDYTLDIAEESVTFTERGSDNAFSVTIDELRESSEEFREVEQICRHELTFGNALVQNGEIYLAARYADGGLFGMAMYSQSSAVACFLYEPETSTFKYIGWLPAESTLRHVIKL